MKIQVKEFRQFFHSQHFEDGFRTTLAVLLPTVVSFYLNQLDIGLTLSTGALCVSLADAPGPVVHRKNGMLFCAVFVFIANLFTAYARLNMYTMGLEVLLFSFFFSMFNVYGTRATSVGNAALLIMVLTMDKGGGSSGALLDSTLVFLGGLWYMLVSLLFYQIRPYRASQRALGECIRELSKFLDIKADFYDTQTDLKDDYLRLVSQQMVVSEKQDVVREILFKTRETIKETTPNGRRLVLAFVDVVDLFEAVTASYYDYESLRKRYANNSVLAGVSHLAKQMAKELDNIGIAIEADISYKRKAGFEKDLADLMSKINQLSKDTDDTNLVLRKIVVNIRKMLQHFSDILLYFDMETVKARRNEKVEYSRFIGHQSLDPKIFLDNFSFSSSVFKHALRLTLACITGFIIAKSFSHGHHSYWIVMTTTFMLKPAFSLTKQRNYERIAGTFIGGIIGVLILAFIPDKQIQFAILVICMIGAYSFQRTRYFVFVIFLTPFILILFKFLGLGFMHVIEERMLDTLIGCVIALLAGYLLFPDWESEQLNRYFYNMLKANENYLLKLLQNLIGKTVSVTDYKLARKEVYVSSANLSAAFYRMLSEPKNKQKNKNAIHQFVVLNHILFSNIATIASGQSLQGAATHAEEIVRPAKKALLVLEESSKKFNLKDPLPVAMDTVSATRHINQPASTEDLPLKNHLEFIYRVSTNISKATDAIIAG